MLSLVLMSKVIWVWKVIGWSDEAVCISGPMHLCVQMYGGYWAIDPWGKCARIWSCIVCCYTVLLGNCCVALLEIVQLCCCCLFVWKLCEFQLKFYRWMLCYVMLGYVMVCYVMFIPIQEVLRCLAAAYIPIYLHSWKEQICDILWENESHIEVVVCVLCCCRLWSMCLYACTVICQYYRKVAFVQESCEYSLNKK